MKSELKNKDYWRSINQLAESPDFQKKLYNEFPSLDTNGDEPVDRRTFLSIMGASLALATFSGCRRPLEEIVPYVKNPEDIVIGQPLQYATAMTIGASTFGVLAKSREGRPIKIEGNEAHPSSLGGTNSFVQASILGLYDPDRSEHLFHGGSVKTWDQFVEYWRKARSEYVELKGEGLVIVSGEFSSPTLLSLKNDFGKQFPKAKWISYEPVSDENIAKGLKIATGKSCMPRYNFDKAKVVLSLDSDFLNIETDNVVSSRGFMEGRKARDEHDSMNRLYCLESAFTLTGAIADHRLQIKSSMIGSFAYALAAELKRIGFKITLPEGLAVSSNNAFPAKWVTFVADNLSQCGGNSLVVAGRRQPVSVHVLVAMINTALGNNGITVNYYDNFHISQSSIDELTTLSNNIKAGKVSGLIMLGVNPVYNAPADSDLRNQIKKVRHSIHVGQYRDETGMLSDWHIPEAHFLEAWGDTRELDGTSCIVQPLIKPLHGGKSHIEVASLITFGTDSPAYDLVQDNWDKTFNSLDANKMWRRTIHDGVYTGSKVKPEQIKIQVDAINSNLTKYKSILRKVDHDALEVVFMADSNVYDGRFANNGWLQEIPDPVTKIMWDNVACMSRKTAESLGVKSEDIVKLTLGKNSIEAPVWVQPGHTDGTIALALGYGREHSGRVGDSVGFDAYKIRTVANRDFATGLKVVSTGATMAIACSQDNHSMEGRPLIREATLSEYKKHPEFAEEMVEVLPLQSLWKEHKYDEGHQWGMTIDLNTCTGCNGCAIACQSENNVPVIGKAEVAKGREMHWLRLDRYYNGEEDNPEMVHQPVACQHCEMAPCEQVCPTAATVHSEEGLNTMVYNRCVGTRYCANNCPYKVRRFNFFNFTKDTPEVQKMVHNPDVTVRSRGVMEKCTYCVQRITAGKLTAKLEGRAVTDEDVIPACQAACPTNAITFGDINDPNSAVSKQKKSNRSYKMLEEFNTRPRTSYLAKIRNPNPLMENI